MSINHDRLTQRWAILLALMLCMLQPVVAAEERKQERSPFTAVRVSENRAIVVVQRDEVELVSIDELAAESILSFCCKTYGDQSEKRFAEDLVEVLTRMGSEPGETVKLVKQALDALERRRQESLTAEELLADLDAFDSLLRQHWSYYRAADADFDAAIAELRAECKQPMPPHEFARRLMRIVALGIDGHASVSHVNLPDGFARFLVEPCGDRFVAFSPDRTGFLDDDHPFIDQSSLESVNLASTTTTARSSC